MKKIYKYTLLLIAAFLFAPLAANADEVDGIKLEKDVSGPDENDQYTITLGTFVNGKEITTVTETSMPTDIVLVLDVSGSMNTTVSGATADVAYSKTYELDYGTTYLIRINGVQYNLRGVRGGYSGNRNYTYYYSATGTPSSSNGTRCYYGTSEPTVQQILDNITGAEEVYRVVNNPNRLQLMQYAVKKFVRTIYQNSPPEGQDRHQIAIVKFASYTGDETVDGDGYNGTQQIYPLNDDDRMIPITDASQCDDIINDLWYGGGTNAGLGLEIASQILSQQSIRENGHAKVTVFFTDGSPGPGGFETNNNTWRNLAYQVARRGVNAAHTLKNIPVSVTDDNGTRIVPSKVFSVALLSSGGYGDRVGRFLHYVSSNYDVTFDDNSTYDFNSNVTPAPQNLDPNWNGTTTGGNETPHGYYNLTSGSDLSKIFEAIAENASTDNPNITLSKTSLVSVDVVSNYFKLPDGVTSDDVSAINVLFAPMIGLKDPTKWNDDDYLKNLDNYVFGTPVDAATAVANTTNPLKLVDGDATHPIVEVSKDEKTGGDKITVKNFDFVENYCGPDIKEGQLDHYRGYKLVIEIPIVVDVQNPGGASLQTNAEGSGIYIMNEDGEYEPLVEFPRPKVTLPNIIIRKFGLLYEGESASFRLEKLTDAGEVDTHVKPYNIVITATDSNPDTYDFVQVKLQHHGRYRVTETDWGWSYDCTVGSKVVYPYISGDNLTEEQEAANAANLAKMEETDGDEDADKMKEINVSGELSPTTFNPSNASQPYINRDVSGDTEQTVNLPGGSVLSGAVFDFHNTIKTETVGGQTKPLEKRNYSEAYKLNIFKFKGTVTTEESDETGN